MSDKKPVIVYGANGYTGRLACEFLRNFNIPFIAAGRSHERLEEAMKLVPGIETADYEIVEVEHAVAALTGLFGGAKVVCNFVGPFMLFGDVVVQAALEAGCHYVDSTGEQPFMRDMHEKYDAEYRKRGLLLAPALAYMHTVLDIAVRACAEHEEVDSIEATCVPTGTPTYGSTQTIIQLVRAPEYYLENGELVAWPPAYGADINVPFTSRTLFAMPWSGMPVPVWYQSHPRIRNLKSMTAFTNRDLMVGVHQIYKMYHEKLASLPEEQQVAELSKIATQMQPGMPPRENPLVHRNYDVAIGTGSTSCVRYVVYNHCPYLETGLLQAFGASWLLKQPPMATGFQAPAEAFGYRNLLGALERFGYARLVREQ